MSLRDAGLADEGWKKYFDADEIEEILETTTTTMIMPIMSRRTTTT